MLTYAAMMCGFAYSGVEKLCGLLSIRHFARKTYLRYATLITEKTVENVREVLKKSREAVFRYYSEELDRQPDESGVLDVDASFDGTWHKRGHCSLFGVGAVIEINTGLIIDYEVVGKMCSVCNYHESQHKKKQISDENFQTWKESHALTCQVNYVGTSGGMEPAEAVTCWNRSLQHNMRYTNFIGDGDSAAYKAVVSCNDGEGPYGREHPVVKSECINHVAKRLGYGLRNLRKETQLVETKGGKQRKKSVLGGQKKLTDKVITRLQFYFRRGITRKVNTSEEDMRNDIMSSFEHCSSTDDNPKHHLCPKSTDSWCFYQKALASGDEPASHSTMEISFTLDADQLQRVREVYERLTTDAMMKKCLRGFTQNPNESLHSRIWLYCPKHLATTKRKVDFAAAQAASEYNAGYMDANIYTSMGVPVTSIVQKYLEQKDAAMDMPLKKKMRNKRLQMDLDYTPGGH